MGKLTTEEIVEILTNEIQWCKDNTSEDFGAMTHQLWYIGGLTQARDIIIAAEFEKELGDG